ncbi:Heat shock cognate 70 kDa protein [Trachymyrmex zeteki]|uniref:Heat shock cognate 70 kDa protein n=1 Tax=Mycetomoellerius zeteki TaxID=64791 RepID=A0A151XD50_9HYME|nr:Heat shock cognate 70 kDa protein [Trachymyrmex zeteki]
MSYSADEYIDMIITYGACGGNGYAAGRLYAERFPERKHHPSNRVIQNCIQRLRETGSVFITRSLSYGVQMRFCTEEKILQAYENSGKSVRHIARSFGVSRNSVYRILDRNGVRLCGIQRLTRDEKQDDTCEDKELFYGPRISDYRKPITHFGCTVKVGEMYIGLLAQCEKARKMLSSLTQASIEIDLLFESIDFYMSEKFVDKQKELEAICNPIVTKLYQSGGASGDFPDASGAESNPGDGPIIEKVD